jgi:flagellar biogenesis protein FliO
MMADYGRLLPQEFNNKEQCLHWLKNKQLGTVRSIVLISKNEDWLMVRVPITNENVSIYGEPDEIAWLHLQMVRNQMYSTK